MTDQVSVIMPFFNGEKYLAASIESLLSQSYTGFELILIDDGSEDSCPHIVQSYTDSRIRYFRMPCHCGISRCLNEGIRYARGELIFRMDADDISAPHRLQTQIEFMSEHPNISICGSDTVLIDENGAVTGYRDTKKGDERIKIALCLGETSLAHPSVVMRKSFLKQHKLDYAEDCIYAEDYELWCRGSLFGMYENIPEGLVKYRRHPGSVSMASYARQRETARGVMAAHLSRLGIPASQEDLICHAQFSLGLEASADCPPESRLRQWADKLIDWNKRNHLFSPGLFEEEIESRYQDVYN